MPSLNNGLIRHFTSQGLEVLGKIEGTNEGEHMRFQAFQVRVVKGALIVASLIVRFMRSACPFGHG